MLCSRATEIIVCYQDEGTILLLLGSHVLGSSPSWSCWAGPRNNYAFWKFSCFVCTHTHHPWGNFNTSNVTKNFERPLGYGGREVNVNSRFHGLDLLGGVPVVALPPLVVAPVSMPRCFLPAGLLASRRRVLAADLRRLAWSQSDPAAALIDSIHFLPTRRRRLIPAKPTRLHTGTANDRAKRRVKKLHRITDHAC